MTSTTILVKNTCSTIGTIQGGCRPSSPHRQHWRLLYGCHLHIFTIFKPFKCFYSAIGVPKKICSKNISKPNDSSETHCFVIVFVIVIVRVIVFLFVIMFVFVAVGLVKHARVPACGTRGSKQVCSAPTNKCAIFHSMQIKLLSTL